MKIKLKPGSSEAFSKLFRKSEAAIVAQPGCRSLELLHATGDPDLVFTFSRWENEEALQEYRASGLFLSTWTEVKKLFSDKAEAWTLAESQL